MSNQALNHEQLETMEKQISALKKMQDLEQHRLELQHNVLTNTNLNVDTIYKAYMTCTQMISNTANDGLVIDDTEQSKKALENLNKLGEIHDLLISDLYTFLFQGKGKLDQKAEDPKKETEEIDKPLEAPQPQSEPVIVSEPVVVQ